VDNKSYHVPVQARPCCPVCHKPVYSRAGIHPQCAMAQSEPPRPKKGAIVPLDPAVAVDGAPLDPAAEPVLVSPPAEVTPPARVQLRRGAGRRGGEWAPPPVT